jgi:hypothetical protein
LIRLFAPHPRFARARKRVLIRFANRSNLRLLPPETVEEPEELDP